MNAPEAYRISITRNADSIQPVPGKGVLNILQVSMGGSEQMGGFYLQFRGDPKKVVSMLEMMTEAAKRALPAGHYSDDRNNPNAPSDPLDGSPMSDESCQTLLGELAKAGAERCGYHHDSEQWVKGTCDCKYIPGFAGAAEGLRTSEQTGCAEIRRAYQVLAEP